MATQVIVILAVQKFVSATLPVCATIIYFVQKIYLRTSRQLRVLEIEAKASVYSTFVETVSYFTSQIFDLSNIPNRWKACSQSGHSVGKTQSKAKPCLLSTSPFDRIICFAVFSDGSTWFLSSLSATLLLA